jgi:tetratricopeptide (TPR) repeat protein
MNTAADLESKTTKHPVTPGEVLPANQLLGDLYMELNDPKNALRAYESDLAKHPNRFNSIYGAAIAANKLEYNEKASDYFKKLVKLVGSVDSDRKELQEAREYLNNT